MNNLIQLVDNVLHKWSAAKAISPMQESLDDDPTLSGIDKQSLRDSVIADIIEAHGMGISLI